MSSIGWLDQSEEQQRRMREVIALFAESGTVDDIGIGVVRDGFSDLLFPGLSTVQTRVRYFLFVPWVYQRLEADGVRSERAQGKSTEWEIELIFSLLRGGAQDGVIGREAREKLKQLPSYIYWNGLKTNGIRSFKGTRTDYFRSLDSGNRNGQQRSDDDGTAVAESGWHPNLPDAPNDLWEQATLSLSAEEAAYLQERFVTSHPDSLLAHLARNPAPIDSEIRMPWDAVDVSAGSPRLANSLETARYFSEAIHGAALLYNLMLAEASLARRLPMASERADRYRESLDEWRGMIDARCDAHEKIDMRGFWSTVDASGANVPWATRRFVTLWLEAVASGIDVTSSTELREMIKVRERRLKKGLARLSNPRALETWSGAAGAGRLEFRWSEGRAAINDIAAGLGVS